ncbi:MAG: hypothetical protein MUO85_05095, partial [candidate division Zixibacteria bacterium]|nr:hypothetical protein [candidate division Zixibacteria bacterium]
MKAFGVGCLHFDITKKMPSEFSIQQYTTEIEKTLKKITNISQINIDPLPLSYSDKKIFSFDEDVPDFSDGEEEFPSILPLNISFEIYLPRRVQSEFLRIPEEYVKTRAERFLLEIRNCFFSPVAFATPIEADTEECQPSDAIFLIREYLEQEVKKQDGKLRFNYIGPSPFHADFYLRLTPKKVASTFDLSWERRRGYDKLVFEAGADRFQDENTALKSLFNELDNEFSLYYRIMRSRILYYREWEQLDEHISNTTQSEQSKKVWTKVWAFVCRPFTRWREFSELVDGLCHFRSLLILDKQSLNEAYRNLYASKGYLKQDIEEALQNPPEFPIKEIEDLVHFREQR